MSENKMRDLMNKVESLNESSLKERVIKTISESFETKNSKFWLKLIERLTNSEGCHHTHHDDSTNESSILTCHNDQKKKERRITKACHP